MEGVGFLPLNFPETLQPRTKAKKQKKNRNTNEKPRQKDQTTNQKQNKRNRDRDQTRRILTETYQRKVLPEGNQIDI